MLERFGVDVAAEEILPQGLFFFKRLGDLLEFFVFQQPAGQFIARVELFFGLFIGIRRQEHSGFYLHQCRGHNEKVADNIQVEHFHHADVLHVLLGDLADGNVVDVDVIFFDQIQQKIQRPFEYFQFQLVSHSMFPLIVVRFNFLSLPAKNDLSDLAHGFPGDFLGAALTVVQDLTDMLFTLGQVVALLLKIC